MAEACRESAFDARFGRAQHAAAPNVGAVHEPTSEAHHASRSVSQLIALCHSIGRVSRVGSAVAVALACGMFLACHDRVCVISRVRCVA